MNDLTFEKYLKIEWQHDTKKSEMPNPKTDFNAKNPYYQKYWAHQSLFYYAMSKEFNEHKPFKSFIIGLVVGLFIMWAHLEGYKLL